MSDFATVNNPSKRFKHYLELKGATGKKVFYRPDRFSARDTFRSGLPEITLDGQSFTLQNISFSGLAVDIKNTAAPLPALGKAVPCVLKFHNNVLFESAARVTRVDDTTLAVQFTERVCDVVSLKLQYEDVEIQKQLLETALTRLDLVSSGFKELCADMVFFLRRIEHMASSRQLLVERGTITEADALAQMETALFAEWRSYWIRGNAFLIPLEDAGDKEGIQAHKDYVEAVLTPLFMGAPIFERSYMKPLGYPGDFEIMNMVYDGHDQGDTLYGKFLHRLGLVVAFCIAERMNVVKQEIESIFIKNTEQNSVRIANLGCGSAREVPDILKLYNDEVFRFKLDYLLLDQDQPALNQALNRSRPLAARHPQRVNVKSCQLSFLDLMKPQTTLQKEGAFDIIYTVSLIDYINGRRANILLKSLYSNLKVGGKLIIGNMAATPDRNLFPMDYLTDWVVIYRNPQEMLDLAQGLDNAKVSLVQESTGRVHLLFVERLA